MVLRLPQCVDSADGCVVSRESLEDNVRVEGCKNKRKRTKYLVEMSL